MMDSDSDEELYHTLRSTAEQLQRENNAAGGSDSDEGPPRRRMRMDSSAAAPSTSNPTARPSMRLRSGRSVEAQSEVQQCAVSVQRLDQPRDSAGRSRQNEVQSDNSSGAGDNAAAAANNNLLSPIDSADSNATSTASPSPTPTYYSDSEDGEVQFLGEYGDGEEFYELDDDDESLPSFEGYELEDLQDVPVNRSPAPSPSSPSSPSEDDENSNNPAEGGVVDEDLWEGRRLQRRNAVVLLDQSDDEVEQPDEEAPAAAPAAFLVTVPDSAAGTTCAASCEPVANKSMEEDDGCCLICCELMTNSGEHRICCLKCGHIYGRSCIEKWIKNEARCPECNAKAHKKDVRVIYSKNLRALDTAQLERERAQNEKHQETIRKMELEWAKCRQREHETATKYQNVLRELTTLKERVGTIYSVGDSSKPSTSTAFSVSGVEKRKFVAVNSFAFRDGECRVGAYDEWLNMLAVSQTVKTPLYPNGCYGIKKINLMTMKGQEVTPLHQKEIRDLEFSNSQGDILLSVGLDKKAILTNCNTNVTVQCFTAEAPLWSCAWSKIGQHIFYAGTHNGQIVAFDVRRPGEVLRNIVFPTEDKTPAARIKVITPSPNNSFGMSGLLVQRFSSTWFCELRNEQVIFHQLPVEGALLNVDFEPVSRHALISTRSQLKDQKMIPSRHMVCELNQYRSEAQKTTICTSQVVQTYYGNERTVLTKLNRPSIFTPDRENVFIAAETGGRSPEVSIWNLADSSLHQTLPGKDPVLDFVPCNLNNNFFLATISANNLNIYKQSNS